jgi:hypothetical protein
MLSSGAIIMILSDVELAEKLEGYGVPDYALNFAVYNIQSFKHLGTNRGRDEAVALARNIFVRTGVEKNISKATKMLLDLLETDYPVMLTRGHKYSSIPDIPFSIRPQCPECDHKMMLWRVNTSDKNQVGGNYKTQWICSDEENCGYQDEYSEMTVEEQIKYHNTLASK